MAPTKSNRMAKAKPAASRKSSRRKTAVKNAHDDKENEPAAMNNDGRESLLLPAEKHDEQEKNWWLINVEKAASLIERCMKEYGWERALAKRILGAYRQFLLLTKEHADWDATKFWPCWAVGRMWTEHSKMDDYDHDMLDLLGHAVSLKRHITSEEQERLDDATVDALKERFGAYDADLWERRDIIVQDQLGENCVIVTDRREPLRECFEIYLDSRKVDPAEDEKYVFEFDGKPISGEDTLMKLGFEEGPIIEVEANHIDKVAVTFINSSGDVRTVLARKTEMISKVLVDSDEDYFKERSKYAFLHRRKRIYGFESPIALDMKPRGNVIDVVPAEQYKCKKCVCCNPTLADWESDEIEEID